MKRIISFVLVMVLVLSVCAGCAKNEPSPPPTAATTTTAEPTETTTQLVPVSDGRARPSTCGQLKVVNGKLCSEKGEPVMLRGASSYGLITAESYIDEQLFSELSRDSGMNLFRLAMYTYGVGIIGYCTDGDKERHLTDIDNGVNYAKNQDMYVIIDWHNLIDGDPNKYVDQSMEFFAEVAEKYKDYNNVLYEICNEPNGEGVDWQTIKQYAEKVIPVIREKDPDSVIIVGTPQWSRNVDQALEDPLDYENLMYTFHFYSASHGEELRNMVESVSQSGLPIFVTEFGITADSGNFPRDIESADIWIDMLERENISYCMWSFSSVAEASACIFHNVLKHNGFVEEDYTETGIWLLETLKKHNTQ